MPQEETKAEEIGVELGKTFADLMFGLHVSPGKIAKRLRVMGDVFKDMAETTGSESTKRLSEMMYKLAERVFEIADPADALERKPVPLTLRVGDDGRMTLPADIRDLYDIKSGDFVVLDLKGIIRREDLRPS